MNNLRCADDTILMAEREEELKSLVLKVKMESEKHWLKAERSEKEDYGIQSLHFTANRWGINGNNDRLFSWAPKSPQMVTATMKLKTFSLEEKL